MLLKGLRCNVLYTIEVQLRKKGYLEVFFDRIQWNITLTPLVALVAGSRPGRSQFCQFFALRFNVDVKVAY